MRAFQPERIKVIGYVYSCALIDLVVFGIVCVNLSVRAAVLLILKIFNPQIVDSLPPILCVYLVYSDVVDCPLN